MLSFAGFLVGFMARPIGGIVCGHLGDRIGRKRVLILSLFMMGAATFLMGLLPTYNSSGICAAPAARAAHRAGPRGRRRVERQHSHHQ
jgi:MFS family permease